MPARKDIRSILIIGSGPIRIGQACEFDYSGSQACRALRKHGYRTILVNSNPATIMTDPGTADATYIEPLRFDVLEMIIEREKPDALLPTLGGQTALNLMMELHERQVLERHGVEILGATPNTVRDAEDRAAFRRVAQRIGAKTADAIVVRSISQTDHVIEQIGLPAVLRPAYTLGGGGGGVAHDEEEFRRILALGLAESPIGEVEVNRYLTGWKEFELEVVRDSADNCIIVCSIENIDPMGIHTGDSITVAPAMTLTDREYQEMRQIAFDVVREVGVSTGGANVQFAVNPKNGDIRLVEMNPRVSRSSALASKATGFPIAEVAALLAVGFTLDEIDNEVTGGRFPASFEPSLDYVVCKVPRFNFDKFPAADPRLHSRMRSVGEVMSIGRSFPEAFQKALVSLETGLTGLNEVLPDGIDHVDAETAISEKLTRLTPEWPQYVAEALRAGWSVDRIHDVTKVDPWFLHWFRVIIESEGELKQQPLGEIAPDVLRNAKRLGFSDARLATLFSTSETVVRHKRHALDIRPAYLRIDTCAGEFPADSSFVYSSYFGSQEITPLGGNPVAVLGSGPNRIGQGIEFDYCCLHAAHAVRDLGYPSIMVNCNPETVSTDSHNSDRLYFEPLTTEHVLEILSFENMHGVLTQFGGQTPLRLSQDIIEAGFTVLGTPIDSIDLTEDRNRFAAEIRRLGFSQPDNDAVSTLDEAKVAVARIGYPVVTRPSYVLGGAAMRTLWNDRELENYFATVVTSRKMLPILIERYLDNAIEVDVDGVCDGTNVEIAGVMQHIDPTGVHSGDSACAYPAHTLSPDMHRKVEELAKVMGPALGIKGLFNMQCAIEGDSLYVIEVNPRASRTIPFISKATGLPVITTATRVALGHPATLGTPAVTGLHMVKEVYLPFDTFPESDPLLGLEMRSTGEVMGFGQTFGEAYLRALTATNFPIDLITRSRGVRSVILTVRDSDKPQLPRLAGRLRRLGFQLLATRGTAEALRKIGFTVSVVTKQGGLDESPEQPTLLEAMQAGHDTLPQIGEVSVCLVINTADDSKSIQDSMYIRTEARKRRIGCITSLATAFALCEALGNESLVCLQDVLGTHDSPDAAPSHGPAVQARR